MKKGLKITLSITVPIATAIILAIVILSVVTVRPLSPFTSGDYKVYVMNTPGTNQNEAKEDDIKSALKTVKFSVMRAMLEFNADYGIKSIVVPKQDGEEGETEYQKMSAPEFLMLKPGFKQYMLMFKYDSIQRHKKFKNENGDQIPFDRLIIVISENDGYLQTVDLYPFVNHNLDNKYVDKDGYTVEEADPNDTECWVSSVNYKVYKFTSKMYTGAFYDALYDQGFVYGASAVGGLE